MKKLLLLLGFLLVVMVVYPQATAVGEFRVATTTTNYGVNLPIGTKIYCIADSTYWVLTAPQLSTADLADGGCIQLNPDEVGLGTVTSIAQGFGMNNSVDPITTTGTVAVDTTVMATRYDLGEAKWTVDGDAGDTEIIGNQTLLFAGGGINSTSYSAAANTLTITGTEVDGSTTNELQTLATTSDATSNTTTLSNSGGSQKLVEGTGITLTTTGTGLDGIVTIAASASGIGVEKYITQTFEQADDIADAFVLSYDPIAESRMTVSLNGYELKADQFTTVFGGSPTVTLGIPTYTYDRVTVSYTYNAP